MLRHLVSLLNHRLSRSISLLAAGGVIALATNNSPASMRTSNIVEVQPKSPESFTACEQQALAYAIAYDDYVAAVNTLNDTQYALEECQGGSQYTPSEEQEVKLASMQSVLESP